MEEPNFFTGIKLCAVTPEAKEIVMFGYVIGGAAIVFMTVLAYGGITGRIRLKDRGCCATDPERDLRMRDI